MASLTNSNALKYRHLGQNEEAPERPQGETLRDKILKGYLQKQLRTNNSLEDYRQSQRIFCQASVEESITNTRGLTSFDEFKNSQSSLAVKQILRSSGLSEDDIKLLQSENGVSVLEAPVAREERLRAIKEKLESRQLHLNTLTPQNEQFSGAVPLSRHDFEEEINAVPCTEKADKLTACLVRLQPHTDDGIPADHPINHIKEIAEELFPSKISENEDQTGNKKRKCDWRSDNENAEKSRKETPVLKHVYLAEKPRSFWDMKEIPKIIRSREPKNEKATNVDGNEKSELKNKLYIRKREKVIKQDPSKLFVLTLDEQDLIPFPVIESNRKTLDELREMDKFKNLKVGDASKTLYIKNLSHKASPRDLASLLGHFESKSGPKICYRILNGRMRGQAFVTFQDKDTAKSALDTCNGFILHEKPVVMEYSKQ